ncbi:MAG: pyridoxal phosphate-dependent aminotransferase [Clostridia bacterium]|nr:pyridoxal phosphate-dependent aminotransferase [Clostridia bacterium]
MVNEKLLALGKHRSEIRELFEYGKTLSLKGLPVCDLTLGNPSAPTPTWVTDALLKGINSENVHAYTSAQGSQKARQVVADLLNAYHKTHFSSEGIILTCGAAASLCGVIKTLTESDTDEIAVLTPYFPEYKVFIENAGAKFVPIPFATSDFSVDYNALENLITESTKALIINNPNNPSGKVYTSQEIEFITKILNEKQNKFNHPIFIISDEPYREIVFDGAKLPCIADLYKNTIICYSFSKSLSLPGERIGYIAVSNEIYGFNDLYAGFLGALRSVGYVCAPSIFQYVIENFKQEFSDFSIYESNKNILTSGLLEAGFICNNPKGAFYLMVKAPDGNSKKMSEMAKQIGLLIVPADSFGASGYVRLATCVSKQTAQNAVTLFKTLAKEYKL